MEQQGEAPTAQDVGPDPPSQEKSAASQLESSAMRMPWGGMNGVSSRGKATQKTGWLQEEWSRLEEAPAVLIFCFLIYCQSPARCHWPAVVRDEHLLVVNFIQTSRCGRWELDFITAKSRQMIAKLIVWVRKTLCHQTHSINWAKPWHSGYGLRKRIAKSSFHAEACLVHMVSACLLGPLRQARQENVLKCFWQGLHIR